MSFTADLHLHSAYAYATSSALSVENLAHWAGLKGIDLLATADFTHPDWFRELKGKLVETGDGIYGFGGASFVAGTEVSCVYRQGGRGRRVHILVFAPSLLVAEKLSAAFAGYGNLESDGRPTLSLNARELTSLVLDIEPDCLVIPAHAWTPWYGLYGSKSGFDSLLEAFGDMLDYVPAIETGLSSDPEMNWSLPELSEKTIVSFSDAHSLPKLGREMTVFDGTLSYGSLKEGLRGCGVLYTVEMYPEEGKYHYDGHRKCGVSRHPSESVFDDNLCPECQRPMTLGVLNRILALGGNSAGWGKSAMAGGQGRAQSGGFVSTPGRPPFVRLVPLLDIISAVRNRGANTKGVMDEYHRLVGALGNELQVLLWAGRAELEKAAGPELAEAITRAREGNITVEPGYDGVYGKVSVS